MFLFNPTFMALFLKTGLFDVFLDKKWSIFALQKRPQGVASKNPKLVWDFYSAPTVVEYRRFDSKNESCFLMFFGQKNGGV